MPVAGSNYYSQFSLSNPTTGAAQNADSLPTATATRNGVADAGFVLTVVNSATGLYTVSGVIPSSYATGDWVSISASATVAGVHATAVIETFVVTTISGGIITPSFVGSGSLSTIYCTDEQIAIRAGGDFVLLCPKWQKIAFGGDGVFSAGSPWVLSSASAAFTAAGVSPGNVIWLSKPNSAFKGSGELFGIDSVTATTATLHRVGMASGTGLPPGVAGVNGVEYTVLTLVPQIEDVSFWINRLWNIDPNVPGRQPTDATDLRDIRDFCVLTVITRRLVTEMQDKANNAWALKLQGYREELGIIQIRIDLRWNKTNTSDNTPVSRLFSMRIVR
jgi:hypothetical protein